MILYFVILHHHQKCFMSIHHVSLKHANTDCQATMARTVCQKFSSPPEREGDCGSIRQSTIWSACITDISGLWLVHKFYTGCLSCRNLLITHLFEHVILAKREPIVKSVTRRTLSSNNNMFIYYIFRLIIFVVRTAVDQWFQRNFTTL